MAMLFHITGNDGVTVFSYYLADRLAQQGHKAMLVSVEPEHPNACLLLPPLKDDTELKSLGRILSAPIVTPSAILGNTLTPKSNGNLGVIGYSPYETEANYPKPVETDITAFFAQLNTLVDYIVVDSSKRTPLGNYAADHADFRLCVTSGDEKGLAYRQLLHADRVKHILFQNNPMNPVEDMRHSTSEPIRFVIPHCRPLRSLFNGGYIDTIPIPSRYRKMLEKHIKEMTTVAPTD